MLAINSYKLTVCDTLYKKILRHNDCKECVHVYLSQSQKEEKKLRSYIEKTIGIDNTQKYFIEIDLHSIFYFNKAPNDVRRK